MTILGKVREATCSFADCRGRDISVKSRATSISYFCFWLGTDTSINILQGLRWQLVKKFGFEDTVPQLFNELFNIWCKIIWVTMYWAGLLLYLQLNQIRGVKIFSRASDPNLQCQRHSGHCLHPRHVLLLWCPSAAVFPERDKKKKKNVRKYSKTPFHR